MLSWISSNNLQDFIVKFKVNSLLFVLIQDRKAKLCLLYVGFAETCFSVQKNNRQQNEKKQGAESEKIHSLNELVLTYIIFFWSFYSLLFVNFPFTPLSDGVKLGVKGPGLKGKIRVTSWGTFNAKHGEMHFIYNLVCFVNIFEVQFQTLKIFNKNMPTCS